MARLSRSPNAGLASPGFVTFSFLALASPFFVSGITKLADFAGAIGEVRALTGADASIAPWLAALVIIVQLGGSVLMLSGRRAAVASGAALLAGFTIVATLVAHAWWTREGADRARDMAIFFEHVAICGGFALAIGVAWRR